MSIDYSDDAIGHGHTTDSNAYFSTIYFRKKVSYGKLLLHRYIKQIIYFILTCCSVTTSVTCRYFIERLIFLTISLLIHFFFQEFLYILLMFDRLLISKLIRTNFSSFKMSRFNFQSLGRLILSQISK